MKLIESSSNHVFPTMKAIDEITSRTNLLALNALVGAARAGEAIAGVSTEQAASVEQLGSAVAKLSRVARTLRAV